MTVEYIGEDYNVRQATNTKGIRTYTLGGKFRTTSQSDSEYDVGSHASVPLIGSPHPRDPFAWCTTLTVTNPHPWAGWLVTAQYSSENILDPNPLFEPATFDWDFEQFQTPTFFDRNGDGIGNSAGDVFLDPPVMRDDSRPVVSVTKNLAAVPTWLLTYQDTVNSSAFTLDGLTIATGLAKVNRIAVSRQQVRNGYSFRVVTIDIHLQKNGWDANPIDIGFRKKSGSDRVGILNTDGTEPKVKVFLNGSGAEVTNPTLADAVALSFDVYSQANFSLLPLT